MVTTLWLLIVLAYALSALFAAKRPAMAANGSSTREPDPPSDVQSPIAAATAVGSTPEDAAAPAEPAEPMLELPVSVVEQVYQQLARLEVLERREQMRLVRRAERKQAASRPRL